MIIQLIRYRVRPDSCDGLLSIDGVHYCDTAEPTRLMLPEGIYNVTFSKHPVYKHRAPCLACPELAEQAFMIHGNGVYAAKSGDILLGEFACPGVVLCSRKYFDPLIKRLEKAFHRGTKVTLVITKSTTL